MFKENPREGFGEMSSVMSRIANVWDVPPSTSKLIKEKKKDLLEELGFFPMHEPYRKDRRYTGDYHEFYEDIATELMANQRVTCRLVTQENLSGNYPVAHF